LIKAIIFDCFGVLVTDGWLPFKHQHFGDDTAKLNRATELNHMVDAGLIRYSDFLQEIASMADVTAGEVDHILKGVVPNRPLIDILQHRLKPQYKIGMLSNVADDWLRSMFVPDEIALFDALALSYETGHIKPDPEAYRIIAQRLEVAPEECVFIDDQERNVSAAEAQGMTGVHYRNHEDFLAFISSLQK
jgi:epoxide hydrolase-like predicted phosphatase